jgi:hypothetical protein
MSKSEIMAARGTEAGPGGECQCEGSLGSCLYCTLVQGQEALERLVESGPLVEVAEPVAGETTEPQKSG